MESFINTFDSFKLLTTDLMSSNLDTAGELDMLLVAPSTINLLIIICTEKPRLKSYMYELQPHFYQNWQLTSKKYSKIMKQCLYWQAYIP